LASSLRMDGKIKFDFIRQVSCLSWRGADTCFGRADRLTLGARRQTTVFNALRD
jgi:hypothetical protein